VVVTGIRASLQASNGHQNAGRRCRGRGLRGRHRSVPRCFDREALSRIPGVTVNRGSINGMASAGAPTATGNPTGVTVRGFGTQFNEILIEGRPVASGNGQNFDFSALGAEYVGELDIHKTPDSASPREPSALRSTSSPRGPWITSACRRAPLVPRRTTKKDGGVTPSFGALFSDTFFDDTFGILVAGDYTNQTHPGPPFRHRGLESAYLNSCQMTGGPVCTFRRPTRTITTPANTVRAGTSRTRPCTSSGPTRGAKDGRVAVQWRPADTLLVTLDDNYFIRQRSHRPLAVQHLVRMHAEHLHERDAGLPTAQSPISPTPGGPTDFNAFANRTYITTNTPDSTSPGNRPITGQGCWTSASPRRT